MKCEHIEKWLSDRLDGKLSEERTKALDAHLAKCASCRAYAKSIEKIHKEAERLAKPDVSPVFWERFAARLKDNLESIQQKKERKPRALKWSWAWSGAALLVVVAVSLTLFFSLKKPPQEIYVFSLENSLARIYQELGEDSELEEMFNSILVESIDESLEDSGWREHPDFLENFLIWENLTEEEMKFIESEVRKDIQS